MKEIFVLDACALIAFLAQEEGADVVEKFLRDALATKCHLYMHKINLLEIFYGIYREDGKEKAYEVLKKVTNLPIKIIESLKDNVFVEAGRMKATYRLSLADSIALAETLIRKAKIVTADHHEFDIVEAQEKSIKFSWIR